MVVAFAAGGSTDLIARVLTQRMGAALGQTIIIGLEVWQSTPEELAKLLLDERVKWQKVIADNHIEIN